VEEWNRLLDYEEDAILRGIERGIAARKKDLETQKREAMPLTERNLSPWGWKLHDHLKEFSPNLYRDLKQNGTLYEHCQKIADNAKRELSDHLQTGLPYNQAFELVKDQLYPPPERRSPRKAPTTAPRRRIRLRGDGQP